MYRLSSPSTTTEPARAAVAAVGPAVGLVLFAPEVDAARPAAAAADGDGDVVDELHGTGGPGTEGLAGAAASAKRQDGDGARLAQRSPGRILPGSTC